MKKAHLTQRALLKEKKVVATLSHEDRKKNVAKMFKKLNGRETHSVPSIILQVEF